MPSEPNILKHSESDTKRDIKKSIIFFLGGGGGGGLVAPRLDPPLCKLNSKFKSNNLDTAARILKMKANNN